MILRKLVVIIIIIIIIIITDNTVEGQMRSGSYMFLTPALMRWHSVYRSYTPMTFRR